MELIAEGLACIRGGREVFSGLGFRVAAGTALAVTGSNGAGKSSLLRLVAGLLRPAAGAVRLTDADSDLTAAEQAHFLGHLDPVKGTLTVAENLSFWVRFLGGAPGRPVDAALQAVGLAALGSLPAAYLSAGQRRRLSLARLLAVTRPLWLLDEPTAALDAAAQSDFTGLMREHLGGGGIVIAATHAPLGIDKAQELRLERAA